MKIYTSSSTKQWYTVYIHNNEGAASRGYDMDTRDVIRIKCESDDEAFVKACDLIEEHWEDPDDAFDYLKNQDVTSGDPFVYAIEDPNEELIFDLGFRDIEEYFEEIESCVAVEASTKYYGLFEYLPGSPEDGMSADSFNLLEVVEAPSEDAAVKMLNPPKDDDSQFVRELTKEDYEMYGVDLTYPLDPSKISSSETSYKSNVEVTANSVEHTYEVTVGDVESYSVNAVSEEAAIQFVIDNYFTREDEEEYEDDPNYIWAELIEDDITASSDIWPEELTYDEYDEGDQIIDAFIEVIDDLGFFEEPSAQGGMGSDFIYDENDNLILEIDLQEEKDILTDMYYSSTSRKDFKKKIRDWIRSESSGSDVFSSNNTKSYEYKGCRIYDTGNGYNIYREGRLISNILFETTSDAEEFVREYLGVDSSTSIMSSSSKGWWNKYYKEVSLERLCNLIGCNVEDMDSVSDNASYDMKHIAWLIVKSKYLDILEDYSYVELVEDDGRVFPAISDGDYVYDASDEIQDCVEFYDEA